ncbi:MAG: tyrosine-type recombinase/integrase [Bacilli bacterium]|nr:tyrosine-type recombinase/integrase [Bacilli bacterium]
MITRPLSIEEYKQIIELIESGFTYTNEDDKSEHIFRPNIQVSLALQLEANIGLRIGDILRLKVDSFRGNKLEFIEQKTKKLQYRNVNPMIVSLIKDYAIEKGLKKNDYIFNISEKAIQKQLRIICKYLALDNISTHSFRKTYATLQYENSNYDIEAVRLLLNHSNISNTMRYIKANQQKVNQLSEDFFIDINK